MSSFADLVRPGAEPLRWLGTELRSGDRVVATLTRVPVSLWPEARGELLGEPWTVEGKLLYQPRYRFRTGDPASSQPTVEYIHRAPGALVRSTGRTYEIKGRRWDPEAIVTDGGDLIVAAEHYGMVPLRSSLIFGTAAVAEPDLALLVLLLRFMQAIYDAPD